MKTLRRLGRAMGEMRTCHHVGRVLQHYLDGELDDERLAKVTGHLEQCRRCGMEASTYARIKDALVSIRATGILHPEDRLALERLRRFADHLSPSLPPSGP